MIGAGHHVKTIQPSIAIRLQQGDVSFFSSSPFFECAENGFCVSKEKLTGNFMSGEPLLSAVAGPSGGGSGIWFKGRVKISGIWRGVVVIDSNSNGVLDGGDSVSLYKLQGRNSKHIATYIRDPEGIQGWGELISKAKFDVLPSDAKRILTPIEAAYQSALYTFGLI